MLARVDGDAFVPTDTVNPCPGGYSGDPAALAPAPRQWSAGVRNGNGQDFIYGGNGKDDLYGNDHLFGEGDPDKLVDGDGVEAFSGGSGADTCYTRYVSEGFAPVDAALAAPASSWSTGGLPRFGPGVG